MESSGDVVLLSLSTTSRSIGSIYVAIQIDGPAVNVSLLSPEQTTHVFRPDIGVSDSVITVDPKGGTEALAPPQASGLPRLPGADIVLPLWTVRIAVKVQVVAASKLYARW